MNSSEAVRLTTDGALKQDLVFVKGDEIVYTVLESAVQTRLVRLKLGEKSATKLHPDATTSEFEATFTADGATYAFVQSRGNLNLKLAIRDTSTGKDAVFDPGSGFAGVRRPSFHPKGDRVCFGIPAPTGQEIASIGRDGKDRKTLTTGGVNNWPAYAPDGTRIAFCSSRDGTFALYVMSADGSDVKRVGKLDGMQLRPCWAPDGSRLAFTWNQSGTYDIYAINTDGTGLVRLTNSGERSDYATWTPDGKGVVFVGERGGAFDLYRVEVRGS
jgi:Tol biopolymer transport system component